MSLFGGDAKEKNRPTPVELGRYLLKVLLDLGYGSESSVSWEWKRGPHILSITLRRRDDKKEI